MPLNEQTILVIAVVAFSGLILAVAYIAFWARNTLWLLNTKLNESNSRLNTLQQLFEREIGENLPIALDNCVIATQNAIAISKLDYTFPVFLGDASIDGFHARALIQHLVEHRPKVVVELGSGSSTILIATTLRTLGLESELHLSVDHETRYLDIAKRWADLAGVADRVTFLHAPLTQSQFADTNWYSRVADQLDGLKVDLLFVDGPPAYEVGKQQERYPALPALYSFLAEKCTVILDDTNRPGEEAIIQRWTNEFPEFSVERVQRGKGATILRRDVDRG